MGTTADKLNKLLETKQAIKQAIINKGVEVADDTVFADYPSKISSIEVSGGPNYYEDLFLATTADNTDYSYLFYNCNKPTLDVSRFDTSKVTNMQYMFYSCKSLISIDVSNWNTSNVTSMNNMFSNCNKLTSLDVSKWDTSNVTNFGWLFPNTKLTSLDVSNWNTNKVTDMSYMFYNCQSLTSIDVSNWNTSNVTNMNNMFSSCVNLTELNCSSWDISHITASYYFDNVFNECKSLVDFYPPQNINASMSVSKSTVLSHDSLIRILNNLMTQTSTKTLTLGSTNLAKLTAEEIAIATNKGWTVK